MQGPESLTWHFRLEGDEFDIEGVTALFTDGVKLISDEDGRHYLVLDLPFTSAEAQAAHDAAEELITKLNGIAQIAHENHENVHIGTMAWRGTPDGPMTQIILGAGAIRSPRLRVGAVGVVISKGAASRAVAQKPIGDRLLEVADKDEHFERALYLYGSLPHDWRCLYMVLEAAEDGNGGKAALIEKRWVPDGKIKQLKRTANSYKAIGLQARHGSVTQGVPHAEQMLDEARKIIRAILARWAKELEEDLRPSY